MDHKVFIALFAMGLILLGGCNQPSQKQNNHEVYKYTNSVDIDYGKDICSYSDEVIETVRYGGRITMKNGSAYKFMSVECVAGFYLKMADKENIRQIEIVDFAHGQQYLPADELTYLKSNLRPSPSGMFLTAIDKSNEKMKKYIYDAYPGDFYSWDDVLEMVASQWNIVDNGLKASAN